MSFFTGMKDEALTPFEISAFHAYYSPQTVDIAMAN